MSSTNLTRAEAAARAALISELHYDVTLELHQATEENQTTFESRTRVHFQSEAGETFIDARAEQVHSVLLDGHDISAAALSFRNNKYDASQGIRLALTSGAHDLEIVATMRYSRTGQGLHRYQDPADGEVYLYTQFETADAKRVFACFDQPDLKATYNFHITAPCAWKVVTNAENHTTNHDGFVLHDSTITYPLSPYLIAVCAGPYFEATDTWRGSLTHHPETPEGEPTDLEIPLAIYCRQSLAKYLDTETLFAQTKQGFDFYHANFGIAYPFGKYDQLFVPEFNMGAMENPGAVTFRDEYVFNSKVTRYFYERRCDTILHEMAHMWFGDLVTMRWWDDLWLNESFATWASALAQAEATEFTTAWVTFANVEKSWAYRQDQLPSTHPISTDASDIETVEQNFDGITYAKGASVLKQLQAYVGLEPFLAGVRQYFADHRFGNATFDDLLAALTASSGRDLSGWANQWLKSTGVNTVGVDFDVADGQYRSFTITQKGAQPGASELRTHRIQVGLYNLKNGKVERTHSQRLDISSAATEVPEFAGLPAADLVLLNDEDLAYTLVELDDASAQFLIEHIADITDPMARTLCWSTAWQMTRDGRMRARDFIALVAKGLPTETEIAVVQLVLRQAATALRSYADPTWAKETGNVQFATALREALDTTPAGSDRQLAFYQALTSAQLPTEIRTELAAIAAGEEVFEGLTIDTDARWRALTARIAHGDVADAPLAIAELLRADGSSTAQNHSWAAYAAQHDAGVKQEIFAELTTIPNTLSNLEIRHKLLGWHAPAAAELLRDFDSEIFEIAPKLWEKLEPEMAQVVIEGIMPTWAISEDTLTRMDAFLAREDLSTGLQRKFAEARADVARSLKNQQIDAV